VGPWDDSPSKIAVVVTHPKAAGQSASLGLLFADLDCPLDVTRSLLKRDLLTQLEKNDAFKFLRQGVSVSEQDEQNIRLHDIAPRRLNAVTRVPENVLTIGFD